MYKLLIASLKQYFRDKEAVFWTILFPVIFLLLFRLFNFGGSINANIIVINESNSFESSVVIKALSDIDGIGINTEYTDLEQAKKYLEESEEVQFEIAKLESDEITYFNDKRSATIVLYFPKDYSGADKKADIYYDQASESQLSPSFIISGIIDDVTASISGVENPFEVERKGVSANQIEYFYLVF
ncbi:MAG: ABC transporter permease [Candidatus Dojkabacteria bacterium]|nr:ABC transporter permease [Candidatus Dojkabacteria bacterium]MDQ7021553.1 ABC transporter permease [Candidatus Dojkabacteria bacterium]